VEDVRNVARSKHRWVHDAAKNLRVLKTRRWMKKLNKELTLKEFSPLIYKIGNFFLWNKKLRTSEDLTPKE
jgi:hypothetical protein